MEPLVDSGHAKEAGRRARGGGGSLAGPEHGRHIVGSVLGGPLANIIALCHRFLLEKAACELQVGVRDITSQVLPGDEALLDVSGDGSAP